MQVYGNVYVSEGQCLGEQAGSIKITENRPGHVEEAASPVENEEQLFPVRGTCLRGIEGDLTSEGGSSFSGGLEVQPQHCDCWSIESPSCPHASCSLSPFRLSPDTHVRQFGVSLLLPWQPVEFSASHSGLSYHKSCLPEDAPLLGWSWKPRLCVRSAPEPSPHPSLSRGRL